MIRDQLELLDLVTNAVKNEKFRELMQEGNYEEAFKLIGLSSPTPEQAKALQELASDWQPLQDLAKSFGSPGTILN